MCRASGSSRAREPFGRPNPHLWPNPSRLQSLTLTLTIVFAAPPPPPRAARRCLPPAWPLVAHRPHLSTRRPSHLESPSPQTEDAKPNQKPPRVASLEVFCGLTVADSP
ncbi:hypothetical protein GUJ93_ZPchr0014g46620 [Zizania palustris]|uniref:Uncharacterized protein n=1 Tax=Zizania palustris TaxID=103762 RepID=A0A8J5SV15_ZIZPA|nr:hypothetical protein GUJ93_ZPchr0014g46620 [Zizania palustris]